ncbi:soluble NSF attachment protein [Gorgonomyces haynaldii]|nr:soluble NSF attachment protein [Gorgonomyces haynaldii]
MSAQDLVTQAEKALNKKSLFGFGQAKPEYDVALDLYTQAGNMYRSQKQNDKASECFVKSAECHIKVNSVFLAAKQYETAALLSQNPQLYKLASDQFIIHGSGDRAAEMLEKAAQLVETKDIQEALDYYKQSIELYEDENRLRFGTETFKRAIGFCIKSGLQQDACQLSDRLEMGFIKLNNRPSAFKQALSTLVLQLHFHSLQQAQSMWQQSVSRNPGIHEAQEGQIGAELLQAFEDGNKDQAQKTLQSSVFKYLDVEVARLVKGLVEKVPQKQQAPQAQPMQPESAQVGDLRDEIEEEGFL